MAQPQGNRCVLAQRATIGDRPEVERLWFIHPDNWNRGYETEIAREAVRVPSTCSHLLYRLTRGR